MNKLAHSLYKTICLCFFTFTLLSSCTQIPVQNVIEPSALTIGFGSCANQRWQQPIWDTIATHKPDLFILMGDNVYIDSTNPEEMEQAYQALANEPHFSQFRKEVPIVATWDDHDYGISDSGKEFQGKHETKKAFIKFFNYPELKQMDPQQGGIFHSRWVDFNNKKIQIIMLDTRWYRDQQVASYLTDAQRKALNLGPYQPSLDKTTTILGSQQWAWLEKELQKPADLRILVSSIQFLAEFPGWETWANFPHERKKLLDMLHQYNNDNIVILSGDIHRAEMSRLDYKGQKLLEISSSGLAVDTHPAKVNKHILGEAYVKKNYGILSIQDNGKLSVVASIYDENGNKQLTAKLGE